MADVAVAILIPVTEESGEQTSAMVSWHFGDSMKNLPLLARAFGLAEKEHEEKIRMFCTIGRVNKHKSTREKGFAD